MSTPVMSPAEHLAIQEGLKTLCRVAHRAATNWWLDPRTLQRKERNKGELLMLMVSELSEAMEGERKSLADDHLPHRPMAEVELADCLIRMADYCGAFGYELGAAVLEKLHYNAQRADHTLEERAKPQGKKF